MLVLSILVGYNLYQGGKEINNNKISKAGLYWLIIIAISLIISIVTYVNMNNALKDIESKSERNVGHSEKANASDVTLDAIHYMEDDLNAFFDDDTTELDLGLDDEDFDPESML